MLGRLGNNLFQYALGRVLAEKHGVPLLMDGSWFNRDGWEKVNCLKHLPGPKAGKVKVVRNFSLAARALNRFNGKHYWEYLNVPILREDEKNQSFDSRFLDAPADCMVFGYFQTPLYFKSIEKTLRLELSTHGLGLENGHETLVERITSPDSVAVHIRRSDYVGNPNLDLCGIEYYRRSMTRMRETHAHSHFFIFSDDPAWCANHFSDKDTEIIDHHLHTSPLVDLHLMSLASHHIIANSSYSWWAAWLGEKPGQQVLMPPRWFQQICTPIEEKRLPHWQIMH